MTLVLVQACCFDHESLVAVHTLRQVLHLQLAGLKSSLTTSRQRAALHIKHAQQDFVRHRSLLHQPLVQLQGQITTRLEQITSSGLFYQKD